MPVRCIRSARGGWLTKPGLSVSKAWPLAHRLTGWSATTACSKSSARTRRRIDYLRLPVGECPKAYFWQVQGQMLATGRTWCDFVSYHPEFPGELQIVIRRVQRDQQALAKLVMGLGKFLEEVDAEEAELRAMMTKVAA